ncbi:MAG: hypothetical protein ACJAUD_000684 [Crocinitomicaceae bacterium]|jgi:hypothetical protein
MAKLIKILGRTLGSLIEWSLILIIVLAFIIRSSPVQTYFAKKATDYLSKELNAEVKIDKVAIVFLDRVALDGVLIRDQSGDTLLYTERIIVNLDDINIRKKKFTIASVDVDNAFIHIQRSKANVFNHSFIKEYFAKDTNKKNKIKFAINEAVFTNTRFRYDDHRKEARNSGMDYFHLDAWDINGKLSNLMIKKDVIYANVDEISMKEKSGFKLNNLSTKAEISPRGVLLANLEIKTDDSYVKSSKLNMYSKNYNCFKYFVDSVSFDGKITKSDVSLKDIAYFAYVLDGMDDQVKLKTEIHKKVVNLELRNLDLQYRKQSRIKGTIRLDDYREFDKGLFSEKLDYAYVDLEELSLLKLPASSSTRYIKVSPQVKRLKFFRAREIRLDGQYTEFVLQSKSIETALGGAELDHGVRFIANKKNGSYEFKRSESSDYDVKVNDFNLGKYLGDKNLGIVDGTFFLTGEAYSPSKIIFREILGNVDRFDYLGYPYSNIKINQGSYVNQVFTGKIAVKDKFLDLTYDGFIDFKGDQHMHFTIDANKALLDNLNLTTRNSELKTKCIVDIRGKELDTYVGSVRLEHFNYLSEVDNLDKNATSLSKKEENIEFEQLDLTMTRSKERDRFEIKSSIGNASIDGKFDIHHLAIDLNYQMSRIFPALYKEELARAARHTDEDYDDFEFKVEISDVNKFLTIFYPAIEIADDTKISGKFNSKNWDFQMKLESDYLRYNDIRFNKLVLNHILDSTSIAATYTIDNFIYASNDTVTFNNIEFKTTGGNSQLEHRLSWDQKVSASLNDNSLIEWETDIYDSENYRMIVYPSHFFIQDLKWDIAHESSIRIHGDTIKVNNFELSRNEQNVAINGIITDQDRDQLNFSIKDLNLSEISSFITSDYPMTGVINSKGYITNPFYNLDFKSSGNLLNFNVKDRLIGDINIKANWDKKKQSVKASGDLKYLGEKRFGFVGNYFLYEKVKNLDFDLNFDYTDIQFTNAFLDPDVVSEIRGLLDGEIKLTGTPEEPLLDGDIKLLGGSAFLDILGIHLGIEGPIHIDQFGFYMNGIPVFDEDGNSGNLIGTVFHENFKDFNFDLQFDLESEKTADGSAALGESNKFLVMDLPYSQDGLYYGKGYVTGIANIFGYTDNLEITVDFKTAKGTTVNIPMYGVGEIEEETFITFIDKRSQIDSNVTIPKFDLSGVNIDLNFDVTEDANINIIFNEELGDVINAKGTGDISIKLDDVGDVKMEGVYTVSNGEYNFAIEPISASRIALKQKFIIEPGGSISWAGNPYNAELNLRTYYTLNANLSQISNGDIAAGKGAHQRILSYLDLSGTMSNPSIGFDIKAPDADEIGRTLINRITSDPDELNRQFFFLMLTRRFQPIDDGNSSGNGSAALDLIANQINILLASVSSEYNLNLDFDQDQITGDNKFEFGVSKGFLDDRLILSGSFGVENYGDNTGVVDDNGEQISQELIGDVRLEYLLNESGTFRVNIFNESTDKTIITEGDLGNFTQGAGLNYREDFNSFEDFKMIQYVFDIFRKKSKKKYLGRRKQQRAIPENVGTKEETEPTPIEEDV